MHLDQDQEFNEINATLIYEKVNQFVKCELMQCPYYNREYRLHSQYLEGQNSPNMEEMDKIMFYKTTLNSIHCYFLHPFHVGFKVVKTKSFEDEKKSEATPSVPPSPTSDSRLISWHDEELGQLQSELQARKAMDQHIRGMQYNQYSKFMIGIICNLFCFFLFCLPLLSEHDI